MRLSFIPCLTMLLATDEERIHLFVKGLNTDLQVSALQMTFLEKTFNEVSDFVKKVEGDKHVGHAKMAKKEIWSTGNFSRS